MTPLPDQTLETNCRPALPFDAGQQFERAVLARPCVSGGSRSALRGRNHPKADPSLALTQMDITNPKILMFKGLLFLLLG